MTVDLACGEAAFADLTFTGLEALPGPGEERHALDLLRTPGGAAITAIGAARLGLSVALVSPLGTDPDGDMVRAGLAADGVGFAGRLVERTAVTAVLPVDDERAMATFDPGEEPTAEDIAAVRPRAVVLSLPRLHLAPREAWIYATVGDADARAGGLPGELAHARALIVNEREARLLTGLAPAAAARALARHAPCAVVTRGSDGALAAVGDDLVDAPGIEVEVVDTTGAGDLFTAAYIWSDLRGDPLAERLRWAVLYAALSVRVATAVGGAVTLEELVRAGEQTMEMIRRNR